MGLVTLNLSMVLMMMEGVVRKVRRKKRKKLSSRHRNHQRKPCTERLSLGQRERYGGRRERRERRKQSRKTGRDVIFNMTEYTEPLLSNSTLQVRLKVDTPVHVSGMRGVVNPPVPHFQSRATGRRLGLSATPTPHCAVPISTVQGVEVLQNAEGSE